MERKYYVYLHKTASGKVFYVGKGEGSRAWSQDRHPAWKKYVSEHLNGSFDVEIFQKDLFEAEAEEIEAELIGKYGEHLVNWINPGRDFDYNAIEKFQKLRNKNRKFVEETREFEKSDLSKAIDRYRKALEAMCEYESIVLESGLIGSLDCGPDWGDPNILDRLTICLIKNGMAQEAVDEADRYFSQFPSALTLSIGKKIKARIDKQREN